MLVTSTHDMSLKISPLRLHPPQPRATELPMDKSHASFPSPLICPSVLHAVLLAYSWRRSRTHQHYLRAIITPGPRQVGLWRSWVIGWPFIIIGNDGVNTLHQKDGVTLKTSNYGTYLTPDRFILNILLLPPNLYGTPSSWLSLPDHPLVKAVSLHIAYCTQWTHWSRHKMASILQTIFFNAFG